MTDDRARLLDVTLPSASGTLAAALRMPRLADVAGLLNEDGRIDAAVVARWLPRFVHELVATLDGRVMVFEWAEEIAADAVFIRALLLHVRTLLDTQRERGAVYALCPRCLAWEAPMTIQGYALTVAKPLPSAFDGPILRAPWLGSKTLLAKARPPLPRAAQIRVVVPSALEKLAGTTLRMTTLGEIRHQPQEYDEPDLDDDLDDDPDGEGPRTGAGWRAVLRLVRALQPAPDPADVEGMPLVDFLFLDLVHYLVNVAEVRADTPGLLSCPRCATRFVPVRRDFVA